MFESAPVEFRERTVIDRFITIDGIKFNVDSLIEDMEAIGDDVTFDASLKTTQMYLKYDILNSAGNSRWLVRAEAGPKYNEFLKLLYEIEAKS